ncbi:MAG: SMC-Scp complex subunit ScpB [Firmicutes bacterium]|nr:SMC-Scp complex subunit ScpB [Bacillota bacterium]
MEKLTNIIESIVYVSGNAVEIKDIAEKLGVPEKEILKSVKELQERYSGASGLHLLMFNKKLQFSSNPDYADQVAAVLNPIRERELSRSMLETAAIIAYKQPVTRLDLEEIRGNSEYAVQKLLELKVIEPVGRKDAVGRPVLYGTTDEFLKRFQISSLDELPDYDTLMEKIQLLHGKKEDGDYLYRKDEYIEEVSAAQDAPESSAEPALSTDEPQSGEGTEEDLGLPPIEEEELPDFLKGEDVIKI